MNLHSLIVGRMKWSRRAQKESKKYFSTLGLLKKRGQSYHVQGEKGRVLDSAGAIHSKKDNNAAGERKKKSPLWGGVVPGRGKRRRHGGHLSRGEFRGARAQGPLHTVKSGKIDKVDS